LTKQESNSSGIGAIVRDVAETQTKFKLNKWAGKTRSSAS